MSGPGRISLRARLLIAVTATFLLIMGGVTMLVLSRRLGQQFNADLAACAANKPQKLYGLPGGCTRVRVWLPAGTIAASPAPVRADPAQPG